jgi:hypothetical protein
MDPNCIASRMNVFCLTCLDKNALLTRIALLAAHSLPSSWKTIAQTKITFKVLHQDAIPAGM